MTEDNAPTNDTPPRSSSNESSELTILICSANIGNAEPTPESFNKWVPKDGNIHTPLTNTKYPVDTCIENIPLTSQSADTIAKLKTIAEKKFDIIAIGMQEAAFVDKSHKKNNGEQSMDVSERGNESSSNTSPSPHNSNNANNTPTIPQLGVVGVDDAVQIVNDGICKIEKESKRYNNKIVRKAVKANMVVRGLTTSQAFQSTKIKSNENSVTTIPATAKLGYDTRKFVELIENQCPSYKMVTAKLRGEMRLVVLVLKELEHEIENVYIAGENTGIGGVLANKGGIIATFDIRGTRLSFMTCHLEAHEGAQHYINRNKNLAEIFDGAKTDPNYKLQDATIISHHMFVCGDLNYRIKLDADEDRSKSNKMKRTKTARKVVGGLKSKLLRPSTSPATGSADNCPAPLINESELNASERDGRNAAEASGTEEKTAHEIHFEQAKAFVDAEDWKTLNDADELAKAISKKECLAGFTTLPCNFPPTFKVARCEGYEYNEKRTPSYTDRILWKSADGLKDNVVPFLYEPCPEFITSDHKPIRGGYTLKTNKGPPGHMAKAKSGRASDREVHLLFSDLKCTNLPVMDTSIQGGLADPYILFVSCPKPILWQKAWPSTKVIRRELNPVWKEDYHMALDHGSCLDNEGNISLAGCMLFMTVMDEDYSSGDDNIGTVVLNMNELCHDLDLDVSPDGGKKSWTRSSAGAVQKTVISRPILRNGQEFGMLECTVSAAFLTAKETRSFLKHNAKKKVRTKTRGDTLTNKLSSLFF